MQNAQHKGIRAAFLPDDDLAPRIEQYRVASLVNKIVAVGLRWIIHQFSEFPSEGAIQQRGQQRIEFGGGLGLEVLEPLDLALQRVKISDDLILNA